MASAVWRWGVMAGLLLALLMVGMPADAARKVRKKAKPQVVATDTLRQVFIYSPDEKSGLHAAWLDSTQTWRHIGQLCASDYSRWGNEKRMYQPYVIRANDGTWRAVWQLNNEAPAFAAAYSDDLVTWRPQDYPRMSVQGVFNPVIFKVKSDDPMKEKFMVFFQTADGQYRSTLATNDFRHFAPDKEAGDHVADMVAKNTLLNDTVEIDSRCYSGEIFLLKPAELNALLDFHKQQAADAQLYAETMKDDARRFAGLKPVDATLTVWANQQKAISDKLVGVFFEDISYAADGGLYAELVQNRDFEYTERDHHGWTAATAWSTPQGKLDIRTDGPLSSNNPHYAVLTNQYIQNEGWDGVAVEQGKSYDFSFFARCLDGKKKDFMVSVVDEAGTDVATAKIRVQGNEWKQYAVVLTSRLTTAKARLRLMPLKKGSAAVDMISLFPQDTFKGRKNGLRRDLAEAIAGLHPKFVRFPGGCMSHGDGVDNIYHWTHTVGPLQDRKPDFNIWNYHQTRGLGFYEYFQFCEDIGAEPLPVLAAGVPCQNSSPDAHGYGGQQGGIPMEEMPAYIDELCHLIEWANGDPATSQWAKMRADAGHPEPFHLKYIGIGNEDIISTAFEERCLMICKEIRRRYPEIQICGTVGPFHAPSSDYIEGWRFAKEHQEVFDMVDEHYYETTGWFMHNLDYYDSYDRKGPKVYIGEYASKTRTHESALAEALFLCNVERNGDVIEMTSYAPLLAKDKHHNWNPDMIYFSNTDVRLTPSYHTQRLFSLYGGDKYVTSQISFQLPEGSQVKNRIAASLVKDSKTGKSHLKLVNALPVEVNLKVEGLNIPADANTESFSGKPQDMEVKPVIGKAGKELRLRPYSVNVVTW